VSTDPSTTPAATAKASRTTLTGGVVPLRRALVSVYDKTGLEELARGLHAAGVALVSTGSTASTIEAAGVPVTRVEELTGFPECLDGRVKTLHPKVHAGILADLRRPEHAAQLEELGIEAFQLVVGNLYPFVTTVASGASAEECVEQIDIGGPSMVRAAAKNAANVAVVTSPARYDAVVAAASSGGFTLRQRLELAAEAFRHTAAYDVQVASWYGNVLDADPAVAPPAEPDAARHPHDLPVWQAATFTRSATLRYGENPHQRAALYTRDHGAPGLAQATQLGGKELSYNNLVDGDAARRAAYDFTSPTVAIIKHTNPCGIASGADLVSAYRKAFDCDPVSAYGGVVATNRPVDAATAAAIADVFTEVVVAPGYDDDALEILRGKKNLRVLRCQGRHPSQGVEWRQISGGLLVQDADSIEADGDDPRTWTLATGTPVDDATLADLEFAWRASRAVKSNAIVLVSDLATVGVGMGQVNRVDSAKLAVARAGEERAARAVAASDAFFPFPDGLEVLTAAGVRAIVQPGGSMRDEEVRYAAEAAGISLYLTGVRHFFH
jgi:phosphoribosylaminoimidazolecarboxamide formyltransferase/IMP cyclohydrolase